MLSKEEKNLIIQKVREAGKEKRPSTAEQPTTTFVSTHKARRQ